MRKRATVGIVFLIVFIDLVGFGIVIPILPLYAERFSPTPLVFGLFMASFSAMQFVFAPILGRLSDRFGRRPVLLLSLLGSAVGYLMFGFAGTMTVLFASRIVDGISGGNISTAHAVIADITSEKDRARGMGIIGAAFGLGFIVGPAFGGVLVGIRHWLPGVGAAAMSLVAFVLVLLILPETSTAEGREHARGFGLKPDNLVLALGRPLIPLCLAGIFCLIFAFANFETTFAQYLNDHFGLDARHISFLFVYAGVLAAIVQGGLVGRLAPRFGEARLIAVGCLAGAGALALIPYVPSLPALLAVLAILAIGVGLASPSLTALTSKLTPADEQGGIMGVFQGMSSLGRIAGPFWAEMAYGHFGHSWPYTSGAAVMLVATLLGTSLALSIPTSPSS